MTAKGQHPQKFTLTETKPKVGVALREMRIFLNLSLRATADKLEITPVELGEYERGVGVPPAILVQRAIAFFHHARTAHGHCDVCDFLSDSGRV